MKAFLTTFIITMLWIAPSALAGTYHLDIASRTVNITGKPVEKLTINGSIPGPTLRFTEGEDVTIHVANHLNKATAIHWHGFLLPADMDGVPGFAGFPGIEPGKTFAYRFKIRQSGTYWYHAHAAEQEQDGLYGSIAIAPKGQDPVQADRDYVVLLSDFSDENGIAILRNLKMNPAYYNYNQRTVGDFFRDVKQKGFNEAWQDRKAWGQMRMSPTDLADVSGYTFLTNGKTPSQNWTGIFKAGERVRLRFINASAMTFYDVRIPGLKLTVVSADGQNVEPLPVDEFRFGPAETYDLIVEPKGDEAYTIVAESIDRTGFALGTLAPREGMKGELPTHRPRALLSMEDMGHDMPKMDHSKMDHAAMGHDMSKMDHAAMGHDMGGMNIGWADTGTPAGHQALDYKDLRFLGNQKDTRAAERDIQVTLGGNMERFIWTINGKKFEEAGAIKLKYGERVRLKFVNETMMAHPMHLHGMFVQLDNGQPAGKLPNKHTVIVKPGKSYSVLLTADEPGEWAFHCHLLYHMLSGMMSKAVVATLDEADMPKAPIKAQQKTEGGYHHAH